MKDKYEIFEEAIRHSRRKTIMRSFVKKINIDDYNKKTFREIYIDIDKKCKPIKGIGNLGIYDIVAVLCRNNNINIDKVYIIGNGPKNAIKKLNIKTKKHMINDNIKLNYVTIPNVITAFDLKKYILDENIRYTKNGDIVESYLCKWQKTI